MHVTVRDPYIALCPELQIFQSDHAWSNIYILLDDALPNLEFIQVPFATVQALVPGWPVHGINTYFSPGYSTPLTLDILQWSTVAVQTVIAQCADTHPISLCMQTRLISHFTNLSDIQSKPSSLSATYLNDLIAFPNSLRTGEHIANSTQLHFHLLSPSIWLYKHSGSTPCCFTQFWTISNWLFNYFKHVFISITLQPLGWQIRDVPTFQIWCPHSPWFDLLGLASHTLAFM